MTAPDPYPFGETRPAAEHSGPASDPIDAVAAVIESELGEHVDGSSVARALAGAGWLRTAEDRAVLGAAAVVFDKLKNMAWPENDWDCRDALVDLGSALSRARRVAAGGTEEQ